MSKLKGGGGGGLHSPCNSASVSQPQGPTTQLTLQEEAAIRSAWDTLVVSNYRSVIDTKGDLLAMFHALNLNLLPEVESYMWRAYVAEFGSRLEYNALVELVLLCKAQHEAILKQNPLLSDDLLDAFVALGGGWDTKGAIDNAMMRGMIQQYDLKLDFDRFLEQVDTDGNAEVDFDEFRLLVEEEVTSPLAPQPQRLEYSSPKRMFVPPVLDEVELGTSGLESPHMHRSSFIHHDSSRVVMHGVDAPQSTAHTRSAPLSSVKSSHSGPSSANPASTRASAANLDPSARVAQRISALHPPVVQGTEPSIPKPIPVSSLYRRIGAAITSTAELTSFRERCADAMKEAKRHGNEVLFNEGQSIAQERAHQRQTEQNIFLKRMASERKCHEQFVAEKRQQIHDRDREEKQEKKLRKRRAEAKTRAQLDATKDSPDVFGSPSRRQSQTTNAMIREASLRSGSGRRRSVALTELQLMDAAAAVDEDDDDGIRSVYSTSSSQMSEDGKHQTFNFNHLMKSARSTPTHDVDDNQQSILIASDSRVMEGSQNVASIGVAGGRRKSVNMHGAIPAQVKTIAKAKLRERLFLSTQPTVRLSGNTNQLRLERVRHNAEDAEAAKAKARMPQVPAAKLTPRMRARVGGMTVGEVKESCRTDEFGRERNELNAKLYECYYGRF